MLGNFYSTGQVCSNGTRVFVHKNVRERFIERLVERTRKIRIGDPLDEATQMGPLINGAQRDKVLSYIEKAKPKAQPLPMAAAFQSCRDSTKVASSSRPSSQA